ncbi:Verru_Chthon cassette protein C [Verrucomicrobium spinosum]|nr:Verru_Chthon cassette protein C [Verrucomicrobium spinosum]
MCQLHSIPSSGGRRIFRRRLPGFTLVELLVSMTILAILMTLVANVLSMVQKTWVRTSSRVSQFREARAAFDTMSRNLGQATLNAYWQNGFNQLTSDIIGEARREAVSYVRKSELQFVCGRTDGLFNTGATASNYPGFGVFFQAPLGVTNFNPTADGVTQADTANMVNLLCGRGYFVSWGDDSAFRPAILAGVTTVRPRFRYRLMEYAPPAEANRIYDADLRPIVPDFGDTTAASVNHSKEWFQDAISNTATTGDAATGHGYTRPVADNVIALIISPIVEGNNAGNRAPTWIAPNYEFDSTAVANTGAGLGPQGTQHQLPPALKLTLVAIDQQTAEILAEGAAGGTSPNLLGSSGAGFSMAGSYEADLETLKTFLTSKHYNFRVFTTVVSLKQAKWSL